MERTKGATMKSIREILTPYFAEGEYLEKCVKELENRENKILEENYKNGSSLFIVSHSPAL